LAQAARHLPLVEIPFYLPLHQGRLQEVLLQTVAAGDRVLLMRLNLADRVVADVKMLPLALASRAKEMLAEQVFRVQALGLVVEAVALERLD
jgi:hypothetical protein